MYSSDHPSRSRLLLMLWVLVSFQIIIGHDEARAQQPSINIEAPSLVVADLPFSVTLSAGGVNTLDSLSYTLTVTDLSGNISGAPLTGVLVGGNSIPLSDISIPESGAYQIQVSIEDLQVSQPIRTIPGLFTIIPPFLAIIMALMFRHVLLALAAGGWVGAFILTGYDPFHAILRHIDFLVLTSVISKWNASVLLVILILGGMIGVISRNGAVYGVVDLVTGWAKTPRSGQLATWVMGHIIFFEGFVNTLVVGHTMRPVTDRLKISREKLSFIVDATAAPVASIALISGWIGFEVGLIGDALISVNLNNNPYQTFVETIPYRFYPILMLVFVFFIGVQRRDFGPMYEAEHRTRTTGKVLRDGAVPLTTDEQSLNPVDGVRNHWIHAFIPLIVVILVSFWGMWSSGIQSLQASGQDVENASLWTIFGQGNGSVALLWGSVCGCIVAVVSTVGFRLMPLTDCLNAWFEGLKSVLLAVVILVLAWALVAACRELNTAGYLVHISTGVLTPYMIPALTFIIAAVVSFATGTSWGTMGLIMPLVVPLAVGLTGEAGITGEDAHVILLATISGVLSGAVWGDHCSPISDTTIMSSMASGADHIDHVRTQAPYALLVGGVSILVGDLPGAYGVSPWISLAMSAIVLYLILRFVGKPTE